jgi:hypothetical protein
MTTKRRGGRKHRGEWAAAAGCAIGHHEANKNGLKNNSQ